MTAGPETKNKFKKKKQQHKKTLCYRDNLPLIQERCTFQHLNWAPNEYAKHITASADAFGEKKINECASSTYDSVPSLGSRPTWSVTAVCVFCWSCSEWKVSKYLTYWAFCFLMDTPYSRMIMAYTVSVSTSLHCPLGGGKQTLVTFSSFSWSIL